MDIHAVNIHHSWAQCVQGVINLPAGKTCQLTDALQGKSFPPAGHPVSTEGHRWGWEELSHGRFLEAKFPWVYVKSISDHNKTVTWFKEAILAVSTSRLVLIMKYHSAMKFWKESQKMKSKSRIEWNTSWENILSFWSKALREKYRLGSHR